MWGGNKPTFRADSEPDKCHLHLRLWPPGLRFAMASLSYAALTLENHILSICSSRRHSWKDLTKASNLRNALDERLLPPPSSRASIYPCTRHTDIPLLCIHTFTMDALAHIDIAHLLLLIQTLTYPLTHPATPHASSIHPSIHPTTHACMCTSLHPHICLSIHPSTIHPPPIHPSIQLPMYPSVHLSIHP